MPEKFIGCATDAKFVVPTAVLLSSIDINGEVPDATILVAAFDLSEADRHVICVGAGRLAQRLKFIDIGQEMTRHIERRYSEQYSPAILGRFFFADWIESLDARLLCLDSDMIVNASLLPLFDLEMRPEFFAAVHDLPRKDNLNYFNAGLMLADMDGYKYHKIHTRCLSWLAENPNTPLGDQDALNAIIGDSWYRLDYCWNRYLAEDRRINLHDYESARVAHFADEKPWIHSNHVGAKLYNRYHDILEKRLEKASHPAVTPDSGSFGAKFARKFKKRFSHANSILSSGN